MNAAFYDEMERLPQICRRAPTSQLSASRPSLPFRAGVQSAKGGKGHVSHSSFCGDGMDDLRLLICNRHGRQASARADCLDKLESQMLFCQFTSHEIVVSKIIVVSVNISRSCGITTCNECNLCLLSLTLLAALLRRLLLFHLLVTQSG